MPVSSQPYETQVSKDAEPNGGQGGLRSQHHSRSLEKRHTDEGLCNARAYLQDKQRGKSTKKPPEALGQLSSGQITMAG